MSGSEHAVGEQDSSITEDDNYTTWFGLHTVPFPAMSGSSAVIRHNSDHTCTPAEPIHKDRDTALHVNLSSRRKSFCEFKRTLQDQ